MKRSKKTILSIGCITTILLVFGMASCGEKKHVHDYTLTENIAATCKEKGKKVYSCSCGESYSVNIDKLQHSFSFQSNNDATCTQDGTLTGTCIREGCGETLTRQDVGSALGHNYTEYISNNDATCGQDGTKTAICLNGCGEDRTITDKGTALEHRYGEYISNNDAACEQDGTKTAVCLNGCGTEDVQTDEGTALAHNWENNVCGLCKLETSKGLEYALNDARNGYTVTGIGTCTDNVLIIPQKYENLPVTQIGDNAFAANTTITEIKTTGNVTNIGVSAFENCTSLEKVTLAHDVKYIREEAFRGCTGLKEFVVSNCLEILEGYAFAECSSLGSFEIPHGVENIQEGVFYYCRSLKSMSFPDSLQGIWENGFRGCSSLETVSFGSNIEVIGEAAFDGCKISTIYLDSLKTWCEADIQSSLFYRYPNYNYKDNDLYVGEALITELVIPDGIETIGKNAFAFCGSIEKVTISNGVDTIGESAFEGCENVTNVVISDSVTRIEKNAFYNCEKVESIVIGNGISFIGFDAFSCDSQKLAYNEYGGGFYLGNEENPYVVLAYASSSAIPEIHENTRVCIRLGMHKDNADEALIIPDSVICITYWPESFSGNDWFESVTIGKNVKYIGFSGLATIQFKRWIIRTEEDVEFFGASTKLPSSNATYIELPSSMIVKTNFGALLEVKVTSGEEIPDGAFTGCTLLQKVSLPQTITRIGESAFSNCKSLVEINLPDSITEIGRYAFRDCASLEKIELPELITKIEDSTFSCCKKLQEIIIPDLVTEIGRSAFSDCTALTRIVMPKSVTTVGDYAFHINGVSGDKYRYYKGTEEDWQKITFVGEWSGVNYPSFWYYYSEEEPALTEDGTAYDGKYWYYDEHGEITVWTKETI